MAYVPPHKRNSKESDGPSPVPALFVRKSKKNLNLRPVKFDANQSGKIVYANTAISKWFAVGLNDDQHFPSNIVLQPTSIESIESWQGQKPLVLVNTSLINDDEVGQDNIKKPWAHIAKTVVQDLISSFEVVRSDMEGQSMDEIKPTLVARFGRNLFHGSSTPVETCRNVVTEAFLKQRKRLFYTNLPSLYIQSVIPGLIPKIGLTFEEEKEIYHIQLSDKTRADSIISCKCAVVKGDQRLELYKVELNRVRHMVVDMSCLDKDLDLRLMLCTKRILTAISENEKNSLRNLINAAVLDSSVKGGLRWPMGKASSECRYNVVGIWHTISKTYTNSSMRLKVRHANRYNFLVSNGEVTQEVTLNLKGIASEILGRSLGADSITVMLEAALKMIWEHFLCRGYVAT